MEPGSSRTMEMAALGRPFSLGTLYDCRQDSIVPGVTLWNPDELGRDTREIAKPKSEFEIVASESIEDKSSALNVEASLKASFLCGLVEVEGSAKYLNDHKTSKQQARVTLKYETTTRFRELTMKHLGRGNVKHPYIFEKGIATHVVTAVLYGAQAFFVFDRETSEKENHQDVQGNLKVMIKKIPCISIEGEGSLHMDDKDKENVAKFSCKFHGDFSLEKNPVSFQDAVQVYQSLPGLLGPGGERAVPVKVWLLPLTSLDSSAAQLVRQISIGLVQEAQNILEDFTELEMRCNDAMKSTAVQHFPQIGKKLRSFKEMCSVFKLDFQRTLSRKLPFIRGGGEEEAVLAGILAKRNSSPFNSKNLHEWMDCKEKEIYTLKSFTKLLKNTKVVSSQNVLHEEILSAEHAMCFVFTSLANDEPYLSALSNYLKGGAKPDDPQDPHTYDVEKEQWYLSPQVPDTMRKRAKLFSDFAEANKENKKVKFLTAGLTDKKQKGSSIYLYEEGSTVSHNFEPPSRPDKVTVSDINHDSVTLKICPPRFGAENITSYSVQFCVDGDDGWEETTASKDEDVTVSGLSPNTEYQFRCRAVTSAGVGPVHQLSRAVKTLPCSPPGKPRVEANSSELSVTWQRPAHLGPDVQVLSYMVEFAQTEPALKGEDLQWKEMMSVAEKLIVSELQSETEYVVRVKCDCGVAGWSKESVSVNVSTSKRQFARLAEYLKHISKRLTSDPEPAVYKLPLKKEDIDIEGCQKFALGKGSTRQNRTIMVLGATGSGKSTLINGMINYIAGVEWKDNFRFRLVVEDQSRSQAESQTSDVNVYRLNHQEGFRIPFSLTVVDTPGFGDTRGVSRDKEITEQIRKLFTSADGVDEIDAVCFVTQASLARLTPTQRYVFDSVLSIFGKDVAENIEMLVTFADGKQPPVLEAINISGVPCPKNDLGLPVHFKFNNSALFAENRRSSVVTDEEDSDDDDHNFDEMFWNMGSKSMERFFTSLAQMTTKSLQMTQEVLRERKHLETAVEGLQPQVRVGLAKLEEIRTIQEKMKEHETAMTSNKDFVVEVDVIKAVQVPLTKSGEYITNCQKCSVTCHYPCGIADDGQKMNCSAMDGSGRCTVCPGRCIWNLHFNQRYSWKYEQVRETQTLQDIKDKYEQATKDKLTFQELYERQAEEIDHLQDMIVSLMDQSAHCLTRLQDIALRPNPLTTPGYIDMLIEGEKSEAKDGYQARIKSLEAMKDRAQIISKVAKRDKLHKTDEELSRDKEKTKQKVGFFQKVGSYLGL